MGTLAERLAQLEDQLIELVAKSSQTMSALRAASELRLPQWCIGAGAIRNLVWDHLHALESETRPSDVDLVYYDPSDLSKEREHWLERQLTAKVPELNWEVVNQAAVHLWFQSHCSANVPPLQSLEEGIATWPEFATCVGVSLTDSGVLRVIAPHGLTDLFAMVVRWNPTRVSKSVFLDRVAQKRFTDRWPMVKVLSP